MSGRTVNQKWSHSVGKNEITQATFIGWHSEHFDILRSAKSRVTMTHVQGVCKVQEKPKRDFLVRKPGGQIWKFLPGEKVYFWTPRARRSRYRPDHGEWRGPTVIVRTAMKNISSPGCLLLAAATIEENAAMELDELQDLEDTWKDDKAKEWKAQEGLLKFGKKRGRTKKDAVSTMKGLKSVKKLIQSKFQKPRRHKKDSRRINQKRGEENSVERQAQEDLKEFERRCEEEGIRPDDPRLHYRQRKWKIFLRKMNLLLIRRQNSFGRKFRHKKKPTTGG